jgi:tRNA (cytosine38-C5)-methyltransferase
MESINNNNNIIIEKNNNNLIDLVIFEFFSGIGGMHEALNSIPCINILDIFPFDINLIANITYKYNFNVSPINISLESFSPNDYENYLKKIKKQFKILWSLSPPCQPFTRQGNKKGLEDNRSKAFINLMKILDTTNYLPDYLLLENVKNFENSKATEMLIEILNKKNYDYLQFLINSKEFNIPNSRLRYYIIANKNQKFKYNNKNDIIENWNEFNKINNNNNIPTIKEYLNYSTLIESDLKDFYLPKNLLSKESSIAMDIVTLNDNSTICFTKNYTKLIKGTGSVLLIDNDDNNKNNEKKDLISLTGKLRYFTPKEISKFLNFNEKFGFPKEITIKSQYKLLGNSINVKVVNNLFKYLFNNNNYIN